ncbi:MAG: glycosyltransferase family 4 protein [Planctomycetota bacterium]|nr:glycosyltransferase family 4 protein [Planctomycetota bacterium]
MTNQLHQHKTAPLPKTRPLRILFAPHEICGQMQLLAEGFRAHGHEATAVAYRTNPFGIKNDVCLQFENRTKPGKLAASFNFTMKALRSYDIFHFFYGRSLLPKHLDLPLLKRAGKKIFVHFRGSDIRSRKWLTQVMDPTLPNHKIADDIPRSTTQQIKRLDAWRRYANNLFISIPELLDIVPEAHVVQQAIDLRRWPEERPESQSRGSELVIAHATSNRAYKGTEHLISAVDQIKQRGYAIRLDIIEGIPASEVIHRYRRCDLGVDELLQGSYGNVAIEMMALGKPVIANLGNWYREHRPDLPVVHADPSNIAQKLEALINDPARRQRIGAEGRRYVERWHDVNTHVARLLDIYKNT